MRVLQRRWYSGTVLAVAITVLGTLSALGQSPSGLADRVTTVEQQLQSTQQGTLSLLNRIGGLEQQIRQQRGRIEVLQHQIQLMSQRQKVQYLDLDARISHLEKTLRASPSTPPITAVATVPSTNVPAVASSAAVVTRKSVVGKSSLPATARRHTQPIAAVAASEQALQSSYNSAFQFLRDGDYAESARRFAAFLKAHPNTKLAPNAAYWLGESYYVTGNYQVAIDTFRKLLNSYPASSKAPAAELKIGYCQFELQRFKDAAATFQQVIAAYPGTEIARLAKGRLRAIQLQSGK